MIHNRKKNRGSVFLVEFFQPILINSVSNRTCYTMSRDFQPQEENKPRRRWNFTRGANGSSDKLDDSNVAREHFSLHHYSSTNLEKNVSLRDRSRGIANKRKGNKNLGHRNNETEEGKVGGECTWDAYKGRRYFRDASSFHPSSFPQNVHHSRTSPFPLNFSFLPFSPSERG